jgi:hypothetical protein
LLTFLAFAIVAVGAVAGAAVIRPRSWAVFALAAYVFVVAEIVGIIELLSLFRAVTALHVLVAEGLLAVAVVALVGWRGYEFPRRPQLRAFWPLGFLAAAVAVAVAYELALAIFTPPNNYDSLTYHLSRAAAWYHQHRVGYVDSVNDRESNSAANAEILILFTFLFAHSDRFAAMWQWLAELASMAAIYLVALELRVTRTAALFAALLFATMAQPALQATSTQNDLVAASLIVAAVAFLCPNAGSRYALAALSLGLAIGTKLTAGFVLPALVLVAIKLTPPSEWPRLFGYCVLAIIGFGSYIYVLNLVHAGTIQGAGPSISYWSQHSWRGRADTMLQISRSLVTHTDARDWDRSYFGWLGAFAIAPTALLAIGTIRKRRLTLAARLALAIPIFVVALALFYRFNPWVGRFMLIPIVLAAPLFATLARYRWYAAAVACVGLVTLYQSTTQSVFKPSGLSGGPSIWAMSRSQAQAIPDPPLLPYIAAAENLPADTVVGYAIGSNDFDFPLYGNDLSRTVVRLPQPVQLAAATKQHIRWVFVATGDVTHYPRRRWRKTTLGQSGFELFTARDKASFRPNSSGS